MINADRRQGIVAGVTALDDASLLPDPVRRDALARALVATSSLLAGEKVGDIEAELDHIISNGVPVLEGGHVFRGYSSAGLLTAIAAVAGPAIDTLLPADDGTDVPINVGTITVAFDVAVSLRSGTISLHLADDTLVQTWDVEADAGGTINVSGADVVLTLDADLTPEEEYYVVWGSGIVHSAAGSVNSPLLEGAWSFTAAALATITTLSPLDDATDIAIDTDLVATFSRNITLGAGTVELRATSGDALIDSWTIPDDEGSSAGNAEVTNDDELTLHLTTNLTNDTGYYVLWTLGAAVDALGQDVPALTDKTIWNFTTVAI
jgi:hypothetical protein